MLLSASTIMHKSTPRKSLANITIHLIFFRWKGNSYNTPLTKLEGCSYFDTQLRNLYEVYEVTHPTLHTYINTALYTTATLHYNLCHWPGTVGAQWPRAPPSPVMHGKQSHLHCPVGLIYRSPLEHAVAEDWDLLSDKQRQSAFHSTYFSERAPRRTLCSVYGRMCRISLFLRAREIFVTLAWSKARGVRTRS